MYFKSLYIQMKLERTWMCDLLAKTSLVVDLARMNTPESPHCNHYWSILQNAGKYIKGGQAENDILFINLLVT